MIRTHTDFRGKSESFKVYKERMKLFKKWLKNYLKGEIFWPSSQKGTYIRNDRRK